ncbi:MAG: GNAT family N-acetyltransferase [Roseobacter sp.]
MNQSTGYARALAATGKPPIVLDDGSLVLSRRLGPVTTHMLARVDVTPERIAALGHTCGRGPVVWAPETPPAAGTLPLLPLVSPGYLATLNLEPDLESLRAGLHQKWRNRLKHAEKQGLRVTRQNLPDKSDHWLLVADTAQQLARRYRSWPAELTCAYARENPGDAKLITAHIGRAEVAAMLILRHGDGASYHIAHTRASGRLVSAQCLLMWEAMCWLKRKSVTSFELGLINSEEGAGLARFKLGTGATVKPLGGTWLWWPPLTRLAHPLGRIDQSLMLPA